ncbi:hypothetical protein BLNAU_8408 [Blattamonas nauphoetae]|uniref:Secreted protein n=1 Tax=Blattamonas nauphoetae TaxID=2049346 RepID=A0ABQ9XYK7_9EUKA|nr:hypothetical protein BLNAU_8408 [Blattamonas nauphoetae]
MVWFARKIGILFRQSRSMVDHLSFSFAATLTAHPAHFRIASASTASSTLRHGFGMYGKVRSLSKYNIIDVSEMTIE